MSATSSDFSIPLLDAKIWQNLRQMPGTKANQVIPRIIDRYLEEAPQKIKEIHTAVESANAAALFQCPRLFVLH